MPETNQPGELHDGELIMAPAPSFWHQEIAFRFQRTLHDWVAAHRLGKVIGAPIDMVLSPHRTVQPDVAFIAKDRLDIIPKLRPTSWSCAFVPETWPSPASFPASASRWTRCSRAPSLGARGRGTEDGGPRTRGL